MPFLKKAILFRIAQYSHTSCEWSIKLTLVVCSVSTLLASELA